MTDKRARLADQYRFAGTDPERLVLAQCWQEGCNERVERPFVDATIGHTYCPQHSVLKAGVRP
jgi:hypothetical protein